MGLAASQARLLSITSRMHDVEYKAQNIMNQKVQLATQEDAAYTEYCAALDSKKVQVAFANGSQTTYIDATYSNMCRFDSTGNRKCQYAITDAESGKMIVDQEVYDTYQEYSNDKYSFAWAMLGFVEGGEYSDFCWDDDSNGNNVGGNSGAVHGDASAGGSGSMLAMTEVERIVFEKYKDDSQYVKLKAAYQESLKGDDYSAQKEALANFRDELYSTPALRAEIYELMRLDKSQDKETSLSNRTYISGFPDSYDETMSNKFQYYLRMFEGIVESGGCVSVFDYADEGNTDNEWFTNMIKSGSVILNMYNNNGPDKGWTETSIATSTNENYLKEANDDLRIKKAEAKYEHELNQIKRKDSQYDRDLQNLETERTALKTEMDSIKKVKDDNIERTFGMFS